MSWSVAVEVAVQTAIKAQIDGGGGAAYFEVYDSGNVLLSTLPLTYPCGTVSGTTGQLSCEFGSRDEDAAASGTASYVKLKNSAGVVVESSIPCQAGSSPVAGYFVMPSLSIVIGTPVEGIDPFTVG